MSCKTSLCGSIIPVIVLPMVSASTFRACIDCQHRHGITVNVTVKTMHKVKVIKRGRQEVWLKLKYPVKQT